MTPADLTRIAAEVMGKHRLTWWAVYPWNGGHEVAPRCTCGVLWAEGDKDDLTTQTSRWEAHVAAEVVTALLDAMEADR